jgi:hypothetical protein
MLHLEVKTKQTPERVLNKINEYFGPGGLGLKVTGEGSQCLSFEGSGGYITATLCPEGIVTRVNLETREWEYHAKKFARGLH